MMNRTDTGDNKAIPEVMWSRGKAGVMVTPEVADKIEAIWQKLLESIE